MVIGIIPRVDYAFKKLLGSEHHTRITIHFLNAVHRRARTAVEHRSPDFDAFRNGSKAALLHQSSLCGTTEGRAELSRTAPFHLQVTAETLYSASPMERWAWFLRHADALTAEQVNRLFPDQVFTEVAGVLEMIAQSPEELIEYNARLKAQRDEFARLLCAQQQGLDIGRSEGIELGRTEGLQLGRAEGIQRGMLTGQIILLQKLLQLPVSADHQFAACTLQELEQLAANLQQQFGVGRP
ncbi:MAG: hypothetical protein RIT02_186 [Planctomycetota bacterium]